MWIEFDWHKIWSNAVLMWNKCSGSIKDRKFLTSLTANRFSRTLCQCSYLIYFVFIVIDKYEAKWNLATWRHLYAGWNNFISFCWYFCRSQELIRNAILANDFLKNLDQCQIQAVVEAMYSKEYEAEHNVITEGETGMLHVF